MDADLLAKEKEFRRMNRELQQRAHALMEEVDSVVSIDSKESSFSNIKARRPYSGFRTKDELNKYTGNLVNYENNVDISIQSNPSSPQISDQPGASKSAEEDILPRQENTVAGKAIANLFKAKTEILQNELQTIKSEYKKKCDYCKELEGECKRSEDVKIKLQNRIDSLKDTITKMENNNDGLNTEMQTLTSESSALKKEMDGLKKQIKNLNQQSNNYEVRLNRSFEDNEKLKSALKCSNIEEKELRNEIRKLHEDKRLAVKNLERQRTELLQAFKKQTLLIDNLKKQNACLTTHGRIRLTEEDFSKLLDRKAECS